MGRMDVFTCLESEVRLACRHLSEVFARALNDRIRHSAAVEPGVRAIVGEGV